MPESQLKMVEGMLDSRELQRSLDTRCPGANIIGRRIEVHQELDSTNALARSKAEDQSNHGLVIFAEYQTAGKGRMSRTWHSPRGASILCSAVLLVEQDSVAAKGVWLWTPLAVREALLHACNVQTTIKWPNDLLAGGKKLCGILIESQPRGAGLVALVIGVGINCLQHNRHFPQELRESATSLELESQDPIDRTRVAGCLITALDAWYEKIGSMGAGELANEWQRNALPLGQRVRVNSQGQHFAGSLVELHPESGIVVQLDQGGRRLFCPYTTTLETIE